MAKIKISPLTYLILKQVEKKSNADGYAYNPDTEICGYTFDTKGKTLCTKDQSGFSKSLGIINSLDKKIVDDPTLAAANEKISNQYTDYKAKGGKKEWKKWLDEDYYKTEEGQGVLAGIGKLGGLLGGLFGDQTAPDMSTAQGNGGGKTSAISPIWFVLIALLVVGSLVALFIVAGGGIKKPKAATPVPAPPAPASVPQPAPTPAPQPVITEAGAVLG
jgi:hypothetical protein